MITMSEILFLVNEEKHLPLIDKASDTVWYIGIPQRDNVKIYDSLWYIIRVAEINGVIEYAKESNDPEFRWIDRTKLNYTKPFKSENAISLNGSDTYGVLASTPDIYNGFTFAMWVKIKSSANHSLFYKWNSPTSERTLGLDINSGGYPAISTSSSGASGEYKGAAGGKLTIGQWHHLAYTWESNRVDIMLDGASILTANSSSNATLNQSSRPIYFGAFYSGGAVNVPNADIQQALIYKKALSVSECLELCQQNRVGDISALDSYSDLESWYEFSQFDGTIVEDLKGNNNITMENTTLGNKV